MSNVIWDDAELQEAINRLQEQMPQRMAECVQNACLAIESEAKHRCPADTGELRASITNQIETDGDKVSGVVGTNVEYAPYVHQGTGIYAKDGNGRKDVPWVFFDVKRQEYVSTKGIKPTPFLEDAVDSVAPQLIDYFMGVLNNA